MESVRFFCNQSNYDCTLFDALFSKVREQEKLDVSTIVSLLKTCGEARYNNPEVLEYLLEQTLNHIVNSNI